MDPCVQTFFTESPQYRPKMLYFGVTTGAAQVETLTFPAFAGAAQADFIVIHNQAGSSEALWLDKNAAGTAPTAAAYLAAAIKTKVSIATGDTNADVAAAAVAASTLSAVTLLDNTDGTVTMTQNVYGACVDAAPSNAAGSGAGSIAAAVVTQGLDASLDNGKFDGTVLQTVKGVYVISFNDHYIRIPEAGVTVKTDNLVPQISAVSISSITVELDLVTSGVATNGNFSLIVLGSLAHDAILQW